VRLPAGKVFRLFMAGASVAELSRTYDTTMDRVEEAMRRHAARLLRKKPVHALSCDMGEDCTCGARS
jgi:uncharacterized protein (DUF58 family)